jgi:hypothetical protein
VVIARRCHAEPFSLAPPARAGVRSISIWNRDSSSQTLLLTMTVELGNHQQTTLTPNGC